MRKSLSVCLGMAVVCCAAGSASADVTVGGGKLGYPVELTATTGGKSIRFTSTAVDNATLDAGLFDIPAGYKQVNTFMELFQ